MEARGPGICKAIVDVMQHDVEVACTAYRMHVVKGRPDRQTLGSADEPVAGLPPTRST